MDTGGLSIMIRRGETREGIAVRRRGATDRVWSDGWWGQDLQGGRCRKLQVYTVIKGIINCWGWKTEQIWWQLQHPRNNSPDLHSGLPMEGADCRCVVPDGANPKMGPEKAITFDCRMGNG